VWKNLWPLYLIIAVALVTLVLIGLDSGDKGKTGDDEKGEFVSLPSGLKYQDVKVGTGAEAKSGDRVSVHYTGRLASNKKVFDSSEGKDPHVFTLGRREVIKGWDEGIAGMKVGGKRKLLIPAKLGYGTRGAGDDIPPNADLEFDTELVKVQK
jgi:FKBP-type peptidyl-prolyl cis-trans isomerase FkpA